MSAITKREPLAFLPTVGDLPQTMSSVEIAELTGKRHPDVLRDIRNMLEPLGMAYEQFCSKVPSRGGRPVTVANLPRRECLILVSGYSVELRAKIIDRWEELERASRQPAMDLNNPADLRLLLANYANDNLELQGQIADLTPKAEALDRLATADGSLTITDAAKTLQVRPKDLFGHLRSKRWIYNRLGSDSIAYEDKRQAGLLEHKTTIIHRSDGSEKVTTQVRVTPKGLAKLAKELQAIVQAT